MSVLCPLSHSADVEKVFETPVSDLDKLYIKLYNISIKSHFPNEECITLYRCNSSGFLFYWPQIPGSEQFYNALQHKPWYYMDDKPEFNYALSHIKSNDKVLEVGSGKGAFGKRIASNNYTGLDFSPTAKAMAAKEGIHIENTSIQEFAALHPNSYDVVCSFQVCEHVPDLHGFIGAQLQALKPGGKLIVAVPSEESYISRSVNLALNMPPHHLNRFTDKAMQAIASVFNLKIDAIFHDELNPMHHFDYAYQLFQHRFLKLFGIPYRPILLGWENMLVKGLSLLPAQFLAGGLTNAKSTISHTVVGVYIKP